MKREPSTGVATPTDPDCAAVRHLSTTAYHSYHCRCPEAVAAIRTYNSAYRAAHRPATRVDEFNVESVMQGYRVTLSPAERRVAALRLTAAGKSAAAAAGRIGVSQRTVVRYRRAGRLQVAA